MGDNDDSTDGALKRSGKPFSGPLVPLLSPVSGYRQLPSLPARTSSPFVHRPDWTCDTFIVPAAFPRSISGSTKHPPTAPAPPGVTPELTKKADVGRIVETMMRGQQEAMRCQVDVTNEKEMEAQEQLFVAVNRYRRVRIRGSPEGGSGRGLTLVFAHATGFHKESWEPTIADLLDSLEAPDHLPSLPIEEIWSLDTVNQGNAAILNEETLGGTFDWADIGRDILNFLISYIDSPDAAPALADMTDSTDKVLRPSRKSTDGRLLEPNPNSVYLGASSPLERRWRDRLIVSIGHSSGAAGLAIAVSAVPSIFSSLILLEPAIVDSPVSGIEVATSVLMRRDRWASRDAAKQSLAKNPYFSQWDPRVLDRYVELGLKEATAEGVTLKCRSKDEALLFCDPQSSGPRCAFERLATLPPSLPVHFVFADVNKSLLPERTLEKVRAQVPHATSVRLQGAGHLLPQEMPTATAEAIASFLREIYPARIGGKL